MRNRIRFFSFNAGLLLLKPMPRVQIQPAPYVEERFLALIDTIDSVDADILCFQEVYEKRHKQTLLEGYANRYPYCVMHNQRKWHQWDNGKVILSRFPLDEHRFYTFEEVLLEEKLLAQKGFQQALVTLPDIGVVKLFNAHTTAGGFFRHPERPSIDRVRAKQIEQIFRIAQAEPSLPTIIVGDFNTGPQVSVSNYRQILQAGYVDTMARFHGTIEDETGCVTWDPKNPLNSDGPHKMCPPQKIDHIFLCPRLNRLVTVTDARVLLEQARVRTDQGAVTVSDHSAVITELSY